MKHTIMRIRSHMPCSCKSTDLAAAMAALVMGLMVGQIARCQPIKRDPCPGTHEITTCRIEHHDNVPGFGSDELSICSSGCGP